MYNTKVRFDGDIIITDPCYITKNEVDYNSAPKWWDFLSKAVEEVEQTKDGKISKRYRYPKPEDYPDCRIKTLEDYKNENYDADIAEILYRIEVLISKNPQMHSDMLNVEEKIYHEAENKWQDENQSDWEKCNFGEDMEVLGLKTYLADRTIYGDWSCTTFNSDTKEAIGEFCADAGMVAVFLLDEVLKYNPDFNYHMERPWTTTLIKDFHGTVELAKKIYKDDTYVEVIGEGNINFVGKQTGF